MLIESTTARTLCKWAIEYFDQYNKAPGQHIEDIYYRKLQEGLDKDTAEEIEEDILPDLSEEYVKKGLDVEYLKNETVDHFNAVGLAKLGESISDLMESKQDTLEERLQQAQKLRDEYTPITQNKDDSVDFSHSTALRKLRKAFKNPAEPLIKFGKELGKFINRQLVRGAFVSFLAPEKRGKTYLLLALAKQAVRQGRKVAFFQAGDMNESEQMLRFAVNLTRTNYEEKYCKEHYQPVRDCRLNQTDECDRPERECGFGPMDDGKHMDDYSYDQFIELVQANMDYRPCHNCKMYNERRLGAVWLEKVDEKEPLEFPEARKAWDKYFVKHNRSIRLSTHANGTLSVREIESILNNWEQDDGFIPDVILIDYMDILVPSIRTDFRHQENQKWKDVRKLSQTKRGGQLPLVISPTQADADAYKRYRLELSNFSEDKRKYAHVTAFYGMNQDPYGVEKKLGLLRLNELVVREGSFDAANEVTLLQNLRQGRPITGSFFNYK